MSAVSRADVCVAACADLFAGDGETLVNTVGVIPALGVRLAVRTGEPDLVLHDGVAALVDHTDPLAPRTEGWMPVRRLLDVVAGGRRHAVMGANQLDGDGNQNIGCIGSLRAPHKVLSGFRGAPGNTVNHRVSYWVPRHGTRVFVPGQVDVVTGVGFGRAAAAGAGRYHDPFRVVTDLAVLDFTGRGPRVRLRSVHPGVRVDDVVARTGFALDCGSVAESRTPGADELAIVEEYDPGGLRHAEIGRYP